MDRHEGPNGVVTTKRKFKKNKNERQMLPKKREKRNCRALKDGKDKSWNGKPKEG